MKDCFLRWLLVVSAPAFPLRAVGASVLEFTAASYHVGEDAGEATIRVQRADDVQSIVATGSTL